MAFLPPKLYHELRQWVYSHDPGDFVDFLEDVQTIADGKADAKWAEDGGMGESTDWAEIVFQIRTVKYNIGTYLEEVREGG